MNMYCWKHVYSLICLLVICSMFLALEKVVSGCEQSQIAHCVSVQQMSITKPNFFVPSVYLASVSERPMSTWWLVSALSDTDTWGYRDCPCLLVSKLAFHTCCIQHLWRKISSMMYLLEMQYWFYLPLVILHLFLHSLIALLSLKSGFLSLLYQSINICCLCHLVLQFSFQFYNSNNLTLDLESKTLRPFYLGSNQQTIFW